MSALPQPSSPTRSAGPAHCQALAIRCDGVGKTFPVIDEGAGWRLLLGSASSGPQIEALREVSFVVPKGKFVGIVGRNGAGKSTLLRILGGVYGASAGSVETDGSLSGLFELGGFGNRMLTGREFAARRLSLEGSSRRELPRLLADVREFSELGTAFEHRIVTYSSGMAARLYFAVATAINYDIYLIDEILSVGDEHFQAKCWSRLRKRFGQGASGVLVTHDWSAVLKLCEEAHILEQGRIVKSDRSDRTIQAYLRVESSNIGGASFCEDNPQSYSVTAGADARFALDIVLDEDIEVAISYSIEALRIGFGWEIVLLENHMPVARRRGRYSISICLPGIFLNPGRYVLNLFLTSPRETYGTDDFKVFDSKSWLQAAGIDVFVEGPAATGIASIPVRWRATAT